MSTIPTVAVSIILHEQDGSPIEGAEIEAKLETLEKYQGFVVPDLVEGIVTDATGTAVLNLFPNELGSESSEYRFKISHPSGRTDTIYAVVPNFDCELHNITELDHFEYRSIGAVITKQIADDVADARVTKAAAEEAAATSIEARDVTLQAKADALAAQQVVATDKATVADLKTQTDTAASAAMSAAVEAVGVRDILVAARDDAVDAANVSVNAANTAIEQSEAAGTAKTAAEAAAAQTGLDKESVAADKVIAVNAKDAAVAAKQDLDIAVSTVTTAKDATVTAKTEAESAATTAVTAKDEAVAAKQDVDAAATTVTTAKDAAVTAKTDAEAAATTAVGAKDTAVTSATTATTAATTATDKAVECVQIKADVEAAVDRVGNPNLLINGGFDVWQTGTAFNPNGAASFIADCWVYGKTGALSSCDQGLMAHTDLVSLLGAAAASSITFTCEQDTLLQNRIEEYTRVRGKEVTFSFISDISSGFAIQFGFYDQGNTAWVSSVEVQTSVLGTKDGWYLHSATGTFPSYDLALNIRFAYVSTKLPAATSKQLTGCKLELGAIRTPFESEKYGDVLAQCQRYYETSNVEVLMWRYATETGITAGATGASASFFFKVPKRAVPAITLDSYGSVPTYVLRTPSTQGFGVLSSSLASSPSPRIMSWTADARL